MAGDERGHHHINQDGSNWQNSEDMRIDTDKRIDDEERNRMGCFAPIEESLDLVLEREDDPDSSIISTELSLSLSLSLSVCVCICNLPCIKPTEILRHQGQAECRPLRVDCRGLITGQHRIIVALFLDRKHLLQEPAEGTRSAT